MSTEVLLTLGTTCVGIITAVMLGFIPWAYKINGRLTSIEVQMKFFREQVQVFRDHGPSDTHATLKTIMEHLGIKE